MALENVVYVYFFCTDFCTVKPHRELTPTPDNASIEKL
jgi:hypothetical protein